MKLAPALLAVLSLWARAATACDDLHSHTSVLGVARDGSFVTQRWVSGGVTCALERLELRAPDALLVASYDNDPDTEQGCLARWTVTGPVPLPVLPGEIADSLAARLKAALGLRALGASQQRVSLKQDFSGTCLQVSLRTAQGPLPIWSQATARFVDCLPVQLTAAASPRSPLLFLKYRYDQAVGGCSVHASGAHWLTAREIAAARHLQRAQATFAREQFKAAARAAETALALAPELIRARMLLLRSLALAGTPWSLAEGRVTGFYRDVRECREGNFYDYMSVVAEPIFDAWHEDESFEAWIADEFGRHIAAHGSDEAYSGNWDRP